ncbi:MAG: hypothetical protein AAFN42_06210 [Cyanobacteria bacterium J06554_1]
MQEINFVEKFWLETGGVQNSLAAKFPQSQTHFGNLQYIYPYKKIF